MSDFNPQQALTTKVGPLPLGVWAVAGGGVIGLYLLWRKHQAAASAPAPTSPASAVSSLGGGGLDNTQSGIGNLFSGGSSGTATAPAPQITDNDSWRQAAEIALVAKGYLPQVVDDALAGYLNGSGLTAQQSAIVNLALLAVGPTPIQPPPALPGTVDSPVAPPPPPSIVTTPPPPAPPAPPAPIVTAAPPAAPGPIFGRPQLQRGSSGSWVSTLQSDLNARGAGLDVDGQFGPLTDAAVRNFQASQGIAVDGIVGPITWGRLG